MKVIISGGGTGGHIYPAIAIAEAFKREVENVEILFVGAKGKMEMDVVPKYGYKIEGLEIAGLQRKISLDNLKLPFKIINSLLRARKIVKNFNPDIAIGVGGYASGPLLKVAGWLNVTTFIQEQNSYAGVTNKILAKNAAKIFVAYPEMEKYFPADKIVFTGNPVRKDLEKLDGLREEACKFYGLDPAKKTILIFGGSLGAKALNEVAKSGASFLEDNKDYQLIWQTGSYYNKEYANERMVDFDNVVQLKYIERMDLAYACADVVICRAGALTISEIALAGKAAILIPSPIVAEDHQTKNAAALVERDAAIMIKEGEATNNAFELATQILNDEERLMNLKTNIKWFAKTNADDRIVNEILSNKGRKE